MRGLTWVRARAMTKKATNPVTAAIQSNKSTSSKKKKKKNSSFVIALVVGL